MDKSIQILSDSHARKRLGGIFGFANKSLCRVRSSNKPSPASFPTSRVREAEETRTPRKPAAFARPSCQGEEWGGIRGEQLTRHRLAKLPALLCYVTPVQMPAWWHWSPDSSTWSRDETRSKAAQWLGFTAPLKDQWVERRGVLISGEIQTTVPGSLALGSGQTCSILLTLPSHTH